MESGAVKTINRLADNKLLTAAARLCLCLLCLIAGYYAVLIRDLGADVGKLKAEVATIQVSRTEARTDITRRLERLEANDSADGQRMTGIQVQLAGVQATLGEMRAQLDRIERRRAELPYREGMN